MWFYRIILIPILISGFNATRTKRSVKENSENIFFDVALFHSFEGSVLVNSAILIISLKKLDSFHAKRKVSVAQRVTESGVIYLDTLTIDNDDEDATVQLDVTHAVQAWLEDPDLNLGLKLVLEGVELSQDDGESPELVLDTQHSLVRQKRSKFLSTEFGEEILSATDCRPRKGAKNCCR